MKNMKYRSSSVLWSAVLLFLIECGFGEVIVTNLENLTTKVVNTHEDILTTTEINEEENLTTEISKEEQLLLPIENNDVIPPSKNRNKDISLADLSDELEKYKLPYFIQKNYPYYLSGFDFDDRPIWIAEFGRYNMLKITGRNGSEWTEQFDLMVLQAAHRIIKSRTFKNPDGIDCDFVLDFEGLKMEQLTSVINVAYMLKLARGYRKLLEDNTYLVVIVNANYVTEMLLGLVRPLLGRVMEVVEVFGTNKRRWLPQLLKHFPKSSLPQWYGGQVNYTPVALYG